MKKVLKLVLVLALALALTVSVFAAPSPETNGGNDKPEEYVGRSGSGNSGSTGINVSASGVGVTVNVEDPDAAQAAANMTWARNWAAQHNVNIVAFLPSYDLHVMQNGVEVHTGNVTLTQNGLGNYVGQNLLLVENTNGAINAAYSGPITGEAQNIALTSYSTFTPVVLDAPAQVPVSPATNQSALNATLVVAAVLSAVVAAFAAKRCFDL